MSIFLRIHPLIFLDVNMDTIAENKIWRLQFNERSIRFSIEKFWEERFRIYALEWKQTITWDPHKIDLSTPSYISFCIHENTLKFSWMYVSPHFRGTLMSDYLISLLLDISEEFDIPISETAVIRKPIIAKKLLEWGFVAKNLDTQVELTGISQGVLKIPVVKSVQDLSGRLKNSISKLSQNVFYILTNQQGIGEIVPIHTQFSFQNIEKSHQKIETLASDIVTKRTFYRGKVRKILWK